MRYFPKFGKQTGNNQTDSNTPNPTTSPENSGKEIVPMQPRKKTNHKAKIVEISVEDPTPEDSTLNKNNETNSYEEAHSKEIKTSAYEAYSKDINNIIWPFRETDFFKENKEIISGSLPVKEVLNDQSKRFLISKTKATEIYNSTISIYKNAYKENKIQGFIEILNQYIEKIHEDFNLSQIYEKKIGHSNPITIGKPSSIEAITEPMQRKSALATLASTLVATNSGLEPEIKIAKTCYENLLELKALALEFPESANNVSDSRVLLEALVFCLLMIFHYPPEKDNTRIAINAFATISKKISAKITELDKAYTNQHEELSKKIKQAAADISMLETLQTKVLSIKNSELENTDLGDIISANASLEFINSKKEILKNIISGAGLANTEETLPSLFKQITELNDALSTAANIIKKTLEEKDNQYPDKLKKYQLAQTKINIKIKDLGTDIDNSYKIVFGKEPSSKATSLIEIQGRIEEIYNEKPHDPTNFKKNIERLDTDIKTQKSLIRKNKIDTLRFPIHKNLHSNLDNLTASALAKFKKEYPWTFRFATWFFGYSDSTFKDASINSEKMKKLKELYHGTTKPARFLRWVAGASGDTTHKKLAWHQTLDLMITVQSIKEKTKVGVLPNKITNLFDKKDFTTIQNFKQKEILSIEIQISNTISQINEFNTAENTGDSNLLNTSYDDLSKDAEKLTSLEMDKQQLEHLNKIESYKTRLVNIQTLTDNLNTAKENYKTSSKQIDEIFKQDNTENAKNLIENLKSAQPLPATNSKQEAGNQNETEIKKQMPIANHEESKKLFRQLGALTLHLSRNHLNSTSNQQAISKVEQLKSTLTSTLFTSAPKYKENTIFKNLVISLGQQSGISIIDSNDDDLFTHCGKAVFKAVAKNEKYSNSEIISALKNSYNNYQNTNKKKLFLNIDLETTTNEYFNTENGIIEFLKDFNENKLIEASDLVQDNTSSKDLEESLQLTSSAPTINNDSTQQNMMYKLSSFFKNNQKEESLITNADQTQTTTTSSPSFFSSTVSKIQNTFGKKTTPTQNATTPTPSNNNSE